MTTRLHHSCAIGAHIPRPSALIDAAIRVTATALPDVKILEPRVLHDARGFFMESYSERTMSAAGITDRFVQDNHSQSLRGVLRGLHYQLPPHAQGKLVRVVAGQIFDVAVDVRKTSPTFGKWTGMLLSADDRRMLWIPPGFAHGFIALAERTDVLYKTTDFYYPELDRCLRWNDPAIGIEWPLAGEPQVSEKDSLAPGLAMAQVFP